MANATTPGLVLFVALAAGARRIHIRLGPARVLPVGIACVALAIALWLAHGATTALNARLASIASGEERPSVGSPYVYDDLPRIGDVKVGDQHLVPVRYIREHSRADEPVLCTTWMLGGGTEAFLSERRNPTSFDKPDEIASFGLQDRALFELRRDPPVLIVGNFFDTMGAVERDEIEKGWRKASVPGDVTMFERKK
jgi:hypothetical protein